MLNAATRGIAPADITPRVMIALDDDETVITAYPCSRHVPASLIDALAEAMAEYADATF